MNWVNIENRQSENSDRKSKIKKGLESFSSIQNIIFYKAKQLVLDNTA